MPYVVYKPKKFTPAHQEVIDQAVAICEEYAEQGLVLTLRQIFYQFVARDLVPNRQNEYKRIGDILGDARKAGAFDWRFMVDRTRNVVKPRWWESPSAQMKIAAEQYANDLWRTQKERIEVWVEKDAAIGVIEGVCALNQVSYFSMRGYTSMTEVWEGAQRIRHYIEDGERVTILHIGDHDPSGVDMTRYIEDELHLYLTRDWMLSPHFQRGAGSVTVGDIKKSMRTHMIEQGNDWIAHESPWQVIRIALNMDQIEQYDPPPNPVKFTDSRAADYVEAYGTESWELDALDPAVLQALIQSHIDNYRNMDLWAEAELVQDQQQRTMQSLAARWDEVAEYLATHEVPVAQNGAGEPTEDEEED